MEDECRRLAREGEKATRFGDANKGIQLLEKALAIGIDDINDLPLLSAIYSQLGNAYYAQKLYEKALAFHGNDLMLSRVQKDPVQQAKAYSNMSVTFTMLNEFNQSITCANNVICLAKKLNDKGLECRGLYNLGLAHLQNSILGNPESQEEIIGQLQEAIKCFERHFEIAKERNDEILCGLAIGNLGNAHFYLGDYEQSIIYHLKRLDLARSVGDKSSMRRSFTNMANAYVLIGNYDEADKCYRKALKIAMETSRKNLEAQLLYSLGNVETLRKNYEKAINYYLNHLRLARTLKDQASESRANSSLATALIQLNEFSKALYFLTLNYKLIDKLGDESMKQNILNEIKRVVLLNPNSIIINEEDRICLDASFDPENLTLEDMIFDSIGESDSSNSTKLDNVCFKTATTPQQKQQQFLLPISTSQSSTSQSSFSALSMPNLPLSLSLESFIRECARGSSSTPKKASQIPLGTASIIPTPKTAHNLTNTSTIGDINSENNDMFINTDCGLTRISLCKSMPEIEVNRQEIETSEQSTDEFFDCLERVQGNRINEQRADPGILKDRTNEGGMDLNLPITDEQQQQQNQQQNRRRMSLGANLKSISQQFRKNVFKPISHQLSHSTSVNTSTTTKSSMFSTRRPHSFYGQIPSSADGEDNKKNDKKLLTTKKSSKSKKLEENDAAKCTLTSFEEEEANDNSEIGDLEIANDGKFSTASSPIFRIPDLPAHRRQNNVIENCQKTPIMPSTKNANNKTNKHDRNVVVVGGGKTVGFKRMTSAEQKQQRQQQEHNPEAILDLIETIQSRRMNEQRADMVILPGLNNPKQLLEKFNSLSSQLSSESSLMGEELVDERLYELIVQSQSDRLEDQRSELGGLRSGAGGNISPSKTTPQIQFDENLTQRTDLTEAEERRLSEEEDVTDLVIRMQMGRLEEQRANFSPTSQRNELIDENGMPISTQDKNLEDQAAALIVGRKEYA